MKGQAGTLRVISSTMPSCSGQVTPQGVADAIAMLERAGDSFHGELLRAVSDARIDLLHMTDRTAVLPKAWLRRLAHPVVVLIGDDDYQATGPAGWRCGGEAAAWAASAIVHASGGEAIHYAAAVAGAQKFGRLLLIETDARHGPEWLLGLKDKPIGMIVPVGGVHPIRAGAEQLQ